MRSGVIVVLMVRAAGAGALYHDTAHREGTGNLDGFVAVVEWLEITAPAFFQILAEGGLAGVVHHRILAVARGQARLDDDDAAVPEFRGHTVARHPQGEGLEFGATAAGAAGIRV